MAILKGPLFAADARGTIADLLTITHTQGGITIKRKSAGPRTNTLHQRSIRAMMSYLNIAWNGAHFDATRHNEWAALAAKNRTSPLNAYLTENLNRWAQNQTPRITPQDQADLGPPTYTGSWIAVGGRKTVTFTWNTLLVDSGWARAFFDITAPHPLFNNTNLVGAAKLDTIGIQSFTIYDVTPGPYTYRSRTWLENGIDVAIAASRSAVVT